MAAKMTDKQLMEAFGLSTKGVDATLKEDIRKQIRIMDEQDAIGRYKWYNLPEGMNGALLERMLYYKGQLAMFMYNDQFYILPYTLLGKDDANLDVYGRFIYITPVPFRGQGESKTQSMFSDKPYKVVYDIADAEDADEDCAVILKDYVEQASETIIPRQMVMDPLLTAMSEIFPFARTALIANSGVKAMRVNNEDEYSNVDAAARSITSAALTGKPMIPVVGAIEFQDLTSAGSALKSEEYLIMLQSFDNYRLSLYGLKSGGLFQKKTHMLEAEQDMNTANNDLVYMDGLKRRQEFCDIVNAIWELGIWCEPAESAIGMDTNGDGMAVDQAEEPMMSTGNDEEGGEGDAE